MEENKIPTCSYMSEAIDQIATALSEFQGTVEQPKLEKEVKVKTKNGNSYSFKYADLSACCRAASPALKANGLAVVQVISDGSLVTILTHKSGQWFKSALMLPAQSSDYQAYGSAITYLKRYSYCAILGLVADTDDDANLACGNQAEMKDRRPTNQVAFTGAQLNQALAALAACKTEQEFQALWGQYAQNCPALCANGSDFYKAAAEKIKEINKAAAKK